MASLSAHSGSFSQSGSVTQEALPLGVISSGIDRKATLCHFRDVHVVRYLRVLLAIPQKVLAKEAGISVRELQRIECADIRPNSMTMEKLDSAFQVMMIRRLKEAERGN